MATEHHVIGLSARSAVAPARLGFRLAAAGECLSLYATVLVLVLIGGLNFTAYEAEAIRPLVATSPLLSWAVCAVQSAGVLEPARCGRADDSAAPGARPFAPRVGLAGAGLAAGTFAITSTFLISGPSWAESLGGFPALSAAGGFLIGISPCSGSR